MYKRAGLVLNQRRVRIACGGILLVVLAGGLTYAAIHRSSLAAFLNGRVKRDAVERSVVASPQPVDAGMSKEQEEKTKNGKTAKSYIVEYGKSVADLQGASKTVTVSKDAAGRKRETDALLGKVAASKQNAQAAIKKAAPRSSITREFKGSLINGAVYSNIGDSEVAALRSAGYSIYENVPVHFLLKESVPMINAPTVWGSAPPTSVPAPGSAALPVAQSDTGSGGNTGAGIRVGILDTGVDYTHPDLGGCTQESYLSHACAKVVDGYDFTTKDVNQGPQQKDRNGHGTHVAATVAGNGVLKGVAPDAVIYAYKVLMDDGNGDAAASLAGMERALDPNQDGDTSDHLDVVNMSLGAPGTPDDVLAMEADKLSAAGVVVVAGIGNENGMNYPALHDTIMSPASARSVIGVTDMNKAVSGQADSVPYFVSLGPVLWTKADRVSYALMKPDVSTPGANICAALSSALDISVPHNVNRYPRCVDTRHVSLNGTSMASPHAAGVAVLLKKAHPSWSPTRIKFAMVSSTKQTSLPLLTGGWGLVDALAGVRVDDSTPVFEMTETKPVVTETLSLSIQKIENGQNLKEYEVSYVSAANMDAVSKEWKPLQAAQPLTVGASATSATVNAPVGTLQDGDYILRWQFKDVKGYVASEYSFVTVNKYALVQPEGYHRYPAGKDIPLKVSPERLNASVVYTYGEGENPTVWNPVKGSALSTTNFKNGVYKVKAEAAHDGVTETDTSAFIIDSPEQPGWPSSFDTLSISPSCAGATCYSNVDKLKPLVTDINNDGKKEIILAMAGEKPALTAYSATGSMLWTVPIGDVSTREMATPVVVKGGDGKILVYVFVSNVRTRAADPTHVYSQILAFDQNGAVVIKKDIFKTGDSMKLLSGGILNLVDITGSGKPSLVVTQLNRRSQNRVVTMDLQGNVEKIWTYAGNVEPGSAFGTSTNMHPVFVDLNGDQQKEMIITQLSPDYSDAGAATYTSTLTAYTMDGVVLPSWSIKTKGVVTATPSVSDLDYDGSPELSFLTHCPLWANCSYLYVLDKNGKPKPGWPIYLSASATAGVSNNSTVAIGNLDSNQNTQELFTCYGIGGENSECRVYTLDGKAMAGWPKPVRGVATLTTTLADTNGDGLDEAFVGGSISTSSHYDAVNGWSAKGEVLEGFPKYTQASFYDGVTIDDLEGDGTADLIATTLFRQDRVVNPLDNSVTEQVRKYYSEVNVWSLGGTMSGRNLSWPQDGQNLWMTNSPLLPPSQGMKLSVTSLNGRSSSAPNGACTRCMNHATTLEIRSAAGQPLVPALLLDVDISATGIISVRTEDQYRLATLKPDIAYQLRLKPNGYLAQIKSFPNLFSAQGIVFDKAFMAGGFTTGYGNRIMAGDMGRLQAYMAKRPVAVNKAIQDAYGESRLGDPTLQGNLSIMSRALTTAGAAVGDEWK